MELSVGYQGNYRMIISIGNQPVNFLIIPDSRWVDTVGVDLTPVLHTGELVLIGEELVTVRSVHNDGFAIKEYHVNGTRDTPWIIALDRQQ